MPGPDQLIRGAIALPFGVARRVFGLVGWLLPGGDDDGPEADTADLDIQIAADDAMTREREPVEEAPLVPDDDPGGHIEPEVEVVAESADPEASDTPGPEIRVER